MHPHERVAEEPANRMSPRALHFAIGAALLLVAGGPVPALAQVTETSITLAWTAPGDDDLTGQATRYDVRRSLSPIATLADFLQATPVTGVASPAIAGSTESALASGLMPGTTYWFALRTADEVGNLSGLSNIISAATLPSTDLERPAPVALVLVGTGNTSVTVSWTDVGDDSLTGNATGMEIRWATAAITEANWASATAVAGVPAPGAPGTAHQMTIGGLDRSRDLWFAARARDDVNRQSAINGSLFVARMLDTAPPATPTGMSATVEPVRDVRLRWSANAEPDLAGYHVYRALTSGGTMVRLTSSAATTNEFLDSTTPDSLSLWYAVSAVDGTGNESARTAPFRVYLTAGGISEWNVEAPFPNPSPVGGSVSIPLEVPAAGPYDATVEIQDGAGQHVHTFYVRNAAPGPYVIVWDGRNESGRATAPGVYRAWLRVGDVRRLVRILRTP